MNAKVTEFFKDKRRKRAFWAVVALLAYALVGFFLVPWILGRVIPKKASEVLDREVTIEKIRINPFALSGSFQGLLVKDKDGETLLSWSEVYGNFQLSSIFHWAFTFKEIRVVDPYVNIYIKPDYSLNISDLLETAGESGSAEGAEKPASLPALRIDHLTITNAFADLGDQTLREPWTRQMGPVNLVIDNFHTHPDSENPYSLAGSTEAGMQFAWSGQFFLAPLRSTGDVRVENVNIPEYAPFYQDFVSLTIHQGMIDLSSDYRLQLGGSNEVLAVSNAMFRLSSLEVSANAEGAQNVLEVDLLEVSDTEASLRDRRARIGSVALDGGRLFVHRTPSAEVNLVKMTEPSQTNAAAAGAIVYAMQAVTDLVSTFLNTTNAGVAVIDSVNVTNWALEIRDEVNSRPVELRLHDIALSATNLSNLPGEDLSLDLSLRWDTNGLVKVGVAAKLFPLHSDVEINVDRIELPPLDPYAEPFANVLLLNSELSVDGVARIRRESTEAPFDVTFSGDVTLGHFSSVDGVMGTDLLEWESLDVRGIEAVLHPMEIRIDHIGIRDARARVVVETNRSINVLNAMNVGSSNAPVTIPNLSATRGGSDVSDANEAPLGEEVDLELPPITLSSLVISNATLELRDVSTQPNLSWSITEVNGQIGGLSSTSTQRADLLLTAKVGGTAPVTVRGKANPLNPAVATDLTIEMTGMDLAPLSPYSGRYAGYRLRKGSLDLDLEYAIRNRKLDSENLVVVNQLAFGEKVESPEATKLPVKMGVAVLKDREGVIKLDIPIEGDLDDPEFRLGRVIGRTIMITLTKMLSSPFSLLGGLVGGSAEELSQFTFEPGSMRIPLSETNGLYKLSKALYERPAVEVELTGSVSPESDGLAIRKDKLNQKLKSLRWSELRDEARATTKPEDIILSPDLRIAMLRKYFVEVFPEEVRSSKAPPGLEETFYDQMTDRLLETFEATEDDFRTLASGRADAVEAWLIQKGNVEADRLYLIEPASTPQEGRTVTLQLQ